MAQALKSPNHIGIARQGNHYVITAEFKEGYVVLGVYQTLTKAKRALPSVRRDYLQLRCLEEEV
jgi:hypothetical protein